MTNYKHLTGGNFTLRKREEQGSLSPEQTLSDLGREAEFSPLRPIVTIKVGQLLRNRIGSYWRINSIYPPTGFCWVEKCNWKGKPTGQYGVVYVHELTTPNWFMVEGAKPPRLSLGDRIIYWLAKW